MPLLAVFVVVLAAFHLSEFLLAALFMQAEVSRHCE